LDYIRETQADEYHKVLDWVGDEHKTDDKLIQRITAQLDEQHGSLHVLRQVCAQKAHQSGRGADLGPAKQDLSGEKLLSSILSTTKGCPKMSCRIKRPGITSSIW
jgi:hypothetical protein